MIQTILMCIQKQFFGDGGKPLRSGGHFLKKLIKREEFRGRNGRSRKNAMMAEGGGSTGQDRTGQDNVPMTQLEISS